MSFLDLLATGAKAARASCLTCIKEVLFDNFAGIGRQVDQGEQLQDRGLLGLLEESLPSNLRQLHMPQVSQTHSYLVAHEIDEVLLGLGFHLVDVLGIVDSGQCCFVFESWYDAVFLQQGGTPPAIKTWRAPPCDSGRRAHKLEKLQLLLDLGLLEKPFHAFLEVADPQGRICDQTRSLGLRLRPHIGINP